MPNPSSTELPQQVQDAIAMFHHISGALFFIVNSVICLVIILDGDRRGRAYRKYLLPLQGFSTVLDLFCNVYAPIIQVNSRALYSNSPLAKHIGIVAFITIEVFFFVEVANSYVCCVYYRRNAIPPSLLWLTEKTAFIIFRESPLIYVAAVSTMLGQVLLELKNGMQHASVATRKYQAKAVVSILLQGLVPSLLYIIPIIGELLIYLRTLVWGFDGAACDSTVSTISALLLSVLTTHTFVHSLTILACSAAYRKRLRDIFLSCTKTLRGSKRIEPPRNKFSLHISHFTMYPPTH